MSGKRVCASAILFLGLAAMPAQARDGFYLSLEGGAGIVDDWEHTRTEWTYCGPYTKEAVASFATGFAGFGALGYALGSWRLEIEGGLRHNEIDGYEKDGRIYSVRQGWHDVSGELSEASAMANILYDIGLIDNLSLSIGAGAGGDYSRFKLETHHAAVEDEDWHFAYQGLAGVNYALSEAAVIFVSYRFAHVRDIGFQPTPYLRLDGEDFEKQAATIGVRISLSGPDERATAPLPAPTPDAPAPAPLEREFMVFFGFNQATLSDEALATIKQAVGALRASGSAAIRVIGHADRAGSIAYNKALSLRRARSVKKALIGEGVAAASISISGRGESEPMVPTADGVREAQNRRVHISF